jgi:D-alanine transaminase
MLVFFNGQITDQEKVFISPFDRGFQFSDGVYEVIKYYPKRFFELDAHIARLKNSLNALEIPVPNLDNFKQILEELIARNNLVNSPANIYIQISRGYQFPRRHNFSPDVKPTFFITVEKYLSPEEELANGVKVGLEEDIRWHRCDIKSTSLIPNVLSKHRAAQKGLSEIIWHRKGNITEGTHSNICFIKENSLFTPPLSNFILPGITRKVVLNLCRQFDIPVNETEININGLKEFDEAMILGTVTEITPVIKFEGIDTNLKKPGPICRLLQREYKKLCYE